MSLVIDRLEDNDVAVLETIDGESVYVPRSYLPTEACEGDVVEILKRASEGRWPRGAKTSRLLNRLMNESGRSVKRNKFGGLKAVYTRDVMGDLRTFFEFKINLCFPKPRLH